MDFGGIFRNLFRAPQQGSSASDNGVGVVTTTPDSDIYDDTELARGSGFRSTTGRGHEESRRLPSFRDLDERKDNDAEKPSWEGRAVQPFNPGMSFVFGEMFSMAREMFAEMDKSMKEMDTFFQNENFFRFDSSAPVLDGLMPSNPNLIQGEDQNEPGCGNIREKVLKREGSSKPPVQEDLNDLCKNCKPDRGNIVVPPPSSDRSMEEAWTSRTPSSGFNFDFQFQQQRQYQTSPGGIIIESKTIRDTNEGRSVTTYKRNEKGEVEEEQQFFPRGANGPTSTPTREEPNQMLPWNIFSFFPPRPRM